MRQELAALLPTAADVLGVPAPKALSIEVLTRAAATRKLAAATRRDTPGETPARLGEALAAVGLAEPGTDLAALAPAFHAGHVSAFFDLHERTLFLIDDEPAERRRVVLAHELVHALQDQALNLGALYRARQHSEDATLALSAFLEGQALVASAEIIRRTTPLGAAGPDVAARIVRIAVDSAKEQASSAPTPWLGLQHAFPYEAGEAFMAQRALRRELMGSALWKSIPLTTAQLFAPALEPRTAKLQLQKLLPGSSRPWSNSLGRAGLALLHQLRGGPPFAEGWRGDRVASVQLRGQPIVVWAVLLDSPESAEALAQALRRPPGADERVVEVRGNTVALLHRVPPPQRDRVLSAALDAFAP